MSAGNGGAQHTAKCKSVSSSATGTTAFGFPEYSITCNLKKAVKLTVGTQYFVNVLPTFSSGNYAYLSDEEDTPSGSQFGWGDTLYNSFFNSSAFGYTYSPTGTYASGSACGGIGCDEFSIGFAGAYVN